MKKLFIPVFAMALLFTACSSSGSDANKEAVIQMAAESLEADTGFYSEEYAGCLLEGLVDITGVSWSDIEEALELDGTLESLEAQTSASGAEEEEFMALVFTCMTDANVFEELMDTVIDEVLDSSDADDSSWFSSEGAMNYGDDEYLDLLYDGCKDGSNEDCYVVWSMSPIGSEYEAFGLSCGGRDCDIFDHVPMP